MLRRLLALALVCAPLQAQAAVFVLTLPTLDNDGAPLRSMKSCRVAILDAKGVEIATSGEFDVPKDGIDPATGKAMEIRIALSPESSAQAKLAASGKAVCENLDGEEGEPAIVAHTTFRAARPAAAAVQIRD